LLYEDEVDQPVIVVANDVIEDEVSDDIAAVESGDATESTVNIHFPIGKTQEIVVSVNSPRNISRRSTNRPLPEATASSFPPSGVCRSIENKSCLKDKGENRSHSSDTNDIKSIIQDNSATDVDEVCATLLIKPSRAPMFIMCMLECVILTALGSTAGGNVKNVDRPP